MLAGTAGAYDGVQAGHLIWKPLSRPLLVAMFQACKRLSMLLMFRGIRTRFELMFIFSGRWAFFTGMGYVGPLCDSTGQQC